MRKAQVANEFTILLGIAMIFLMGFMYAIGDSMKDASEEKEMLALRDVGFAVQNELFYAFGLEDGYVRYFEIPVPYKTFTYSVAKAGDYFVYTSNQSSRVEAFLAPAVVGDPVAGMNRLEKRGGVLYLN